MVVRNRDDPTERRSGRGVMIVLIISLAFCLLVAAFAPAQPEYSPTGGACQWAPCGDLEDPALWNYLWWPWQVGMLVFFVAHLVRVVTAPTVADRRLEARLLGGGIDALATASLYTGMSFLWCWTIELIGGLFFSYHMGITMALVSALPLSLLLLHRLPGRNTIPVRLVAVLLAYFYGAVRTIKQFSFVLASGGARPRPRTGDQWLYGGVFWIVFAGCLGCLLYARLCLPAAQRTRGES